jgi:hypothetical protein
MEVAQGGRKITAKGREYLRDLENECGEPSSVLPTTTETLILEENA